MSVRDLLQDPVWKGEELGQPIPAMPHAVSVALPRWQDVVGYEEKKPEVVNALTSGYPRFFIHQEVQELARQIGDGKPCLPFPSVHAAQQCAEFVRRSRQHTGLIVSSREAEAHLAGPVPASDELPVRQSLRRQLAGFYDCAEDDVFLAPTGMAAQFAALQAVMERTPDKPTAQLGFPYVDTLKLQQKLGKGGILLHHLGTIESELQALLGRQALAIFDPATLAIPCSARPMFVR